MAELHEAIKEEVESPIKDIAHSDQLPPPHPKPPSPSEPHTESEQPHHNKK